MLYYLIKDTGGGKKKKKRYYCSSLEEVKCQLPKVSVACKGRIWVQLQFYH